MLNSIEAKYPKNYAYIYSTLRRGKDVEEKCTKVRWCRIERKKWREWGNKSEVGRMGRVGGLGQFMKLPAVMDCALTTAMRLVRSLTTVMALKYQTLSEGISLSDLRTKSFGLPPNVLL